MGVKPEPELRIVERPWRASLAVHPQVVEACSLASLQIRGPSVKRLGVTSAIRGEGRSAVALAMAVVQQRDFANHPLLLEMDFDRPSLSRRLHTEASPGLAELIRGDVTIEEAVQPLSEGIAVITAGAANGAAARLVVDVTGSSLLEQLSERFDVVIADLPPLLGCSFGTLAAELFDPVVLVVRAGITPIAQIREATASLSRPPVVLLNGTQSRLPRWIRSLTHT